MMKMQDLLQQILPALCISRAKSPKGIATLGDTVLNYSDAYLAKFSDSGTLKWATYFGGNSSDEGTGIALDGSGHIYMVGSTSSDSDLATTGAYQSLIGKTKQNAFFAKFDSSGKINWATYYGGNDYCDIYDIAFQDSGSIYFTGDRSSSVSLYSSGNLAQFDNSGRFVTTKYFSGLGYNTVGYDIAVDSVGNIYITGVMADSLYVLNYFVNKYSRSFSLLWSNGCSGKKSSFGYGITTDKNGYVYVSGRTSEKTLSTSGAYQTSIAGGIDAFIAQYFPNGKLNYCTYYGGKADDYIQNVIMGNMGVLYFCGFSGSTSGISTKGVYQSSNAGGSDAIIGGLKFHITPDFNNSGIVSIDSLSSKVCQGSKEDIYVSLENFGWDTLTKVKINWSLNGITQPSYSWSGKLMPNHITPVKLATLSFSSATNKLMVWTSLPNGNTDSFTYNDSANFSFNLYPLPNAIIIGLRPTCFGDSIKFSASGASNNHNLYTWTSNPSVLFPHTKGSFQMLVTTNTIFYLKSIDTLTGCMSLDTYSLIILPKPSIGFSFDKTCFGQTTNFFDTTTIDTPSILKNWNWDFGDNKSYSSKDSKTKNPSHIYKKTGTYNVRLSVSVFPQCSNSINLPITIYDKPDSSFNWSINKATASFTPKDTSITHYTWDFGDASNLDTLKKPVHTYAKSAKYNVSLTVTPGKGCTAKSANSVNVIFTGVPDEVFNDFSCNIYPNPFSDKAIIEYTLEKEAAVKTVVYDLSGKLIATVEDCKKPAGVNRVTFDADKYSCPEGMYILKIFVDGEMVSKRIIKVK